MTNQERALVKAFVTKKYNLHATKWNGNQLVAKADKKDSWAVLLDADEIDAVYQEARSAL